jgi:WD40 repeat protein
MQTQAHFDSDSMDVSKQSTEKLTAFISYARADFAFLHALITGLENNGISVAVDQRDLPYGEEWKAELLNLIRNSDAVIFVVSPQAINSKWCLWELEQAKVLSKRVVPIRLTEVDPAAIPEEVAAIHQLSFSDVWDRATSQPKQSFDSRVNRLAHILNTDRAWLKEHTRLVALAERWALTDRPKNQLLRGDDISAGEQWAARRPRQAPNLTDLLLDYLRASRIADDTDQAERDAQLRRLRRATGVAFVAPLQAAVNQGLHAKAIRYAVAGALLADDPHFEIVPELHRSVVRALADSRLYAVLPHERAPNSARFDLDGRQILTLGVDGKAFIWEASTGATIRELTGHTDEITSASLSPDGKRIATTSWDKSARVWDIGTGAEVMMLREPNAPDLYLQYADNRKSDPKREYIGLRLKEDEPDARLYLRTLVQHHGYRIRNSAIFSPDGKQLVSVFYEYPWMSEPNESRGIGLVVLAKTQIWDTSSKAELNSFLSFKERVVIKISPDCTKAIECSTDKIARVLDLLTGAEIVTMNGHEDAVYDAALSPDGTKVVTASQDTTARIWEASTGKELCVLRGHQDRLTDVSFSPDGYRIITLSKDETARIWDVSTGSTICTLKGHRYGFSTIAFSPDGKRFVSSGDLDDTARIWDAMTGERITELNGHQGGLHGAEFSPDGTWVVTASSDHTARVWDARSRREPNINVAPYKSLILEIERKSPDGKRIASQSMEGLGGPLRPRSKQDKEATGLMEISDVETGFNRTLLRGHLARVWDLNFSPDSKRIVTASDDRTARIWDAITGDELFQLQHPDVVNTAVFSPDGTRIVTACDDALARVWDASSGFELCQVAGAGHDGAVAWFNSDGTRVLTSYLQSSNANSWDVTRTVALSHPLLPKIAPLLAALKRGVGRISGEEANELLLREVPNDLYAAALDKWPYLAVAIANADAVLFDATKSTSSADHNLLGRENSP